MARRTESLRECRPTRHCSRQAAPISGASAGMNLAPCYCGSTNVFSVTTCRQFGQCAVAVSRKSTLPSRPVTSPRIQSKGISESSGWQCSQDSIWLWAWRTWAGSSPHFSPITDEGRFRVKEWVAGESWTLGWTMRRNSWVSTAMRTTISGSKRRDLTCGDRPRPEPKEEVVFPAIDQAYRQQRRGSACRFRRMSAKISA